PEAFAGCFTADGIMESAGFRFEGRDAIRAWKEAGRTFRAKFRVHHVSSIHIDLTSADTASCRSAWFVVTEIGPDHSGLYFDTFVREGDRWLIHHRIADALWRADNSSVGPEVIGSKSGRVRL
ncbi:MAG TPA: nuclear transport factor 2 family protein, partial [Novosphingobium sp.]